LHQAVLVAAYRQDTPCSGRCSPRCAGCATPARRHIRIELPLARFEVPAVTFFLWANFSAYLGESSGLATEIRQRCGLGSAPVRASVDPGQVRLSLWPDEKLMRQATCLAADVTDLPFPDGRFDVVLANFVVNHLDDPRAGMAELSRVLAGDGAIALTIWASGPSVMKQLWDDVIVASDAVPPAVERLPADKDFARTAAGLRELVAGARLVAVQVRTVEWLLRINPDRF